MAVKTSVAAVCAAEPFLSPEDRAARLIGAAESILAKLERGTAIDASALRQALEAAFGGSDAEGAWTWKDGYDACEAAQILFLRKFGRTMRARTSLSRSAARPVQSVRAAIQAVCFGPSLNT